MIKSRTKRAQAVIFFFFFLLATGLSFCTQRSNTTCVIETELGEIEIELYQQEAPNTVANFLQYVDSSHFNHSTFFRTCTPENEADREIQIKVIQSSEIPTKKQFNPIEIETTKQTGILHKDGVLSMARSTPNSATNSFFICIDDQPSLNYEGKRNPDGQGFAAFGKVTKGMKIVRKINQSANENQLINDPIGIIKIRRL